MMDQVGAVPAASSTPPAAALTVTGGEPLLQPAFTARAPAGAKELGLHTALDTSGYLGARAARRAARRHRPGAAGHQVLRPGHLPPGDRRRASTRRSRSPAGSPSRGIAMWIRFVLVPGLPTTGDIVELAGFVARSATWSASTCCRSTRSAPRSTPRSA